jgi:hypothetical protein
MPFAYYDRLTRRQKAVYDASDRVTTVRLPLAESLRPLTEVLREALAADRRPVVEAASRHIADGITAMLEVPPVEVRVLAVRPSLREAELHGLYTRPERGRPDIKVWMRTVHYKRVVAFRTFLRTLLHEVGHHLDYEYLKLAETYHTEGFYKRENSMFYQLVPRAAETTPAPAAETRG